MGPYYGPLGLLGVHIVYSRYIRIPGLRAHIRGPWLFLSGIWGVEGFRGWGV